MAGDSAVGDPDLRPLREALRLAARGRDRVSPNPMVGAVLVDADGREIGRGCHRRVGGPHAEVEAFRDAARRGEDPRGTTLYVTLEPCSHHGRTPPCADAVVEAGVARVIACHGDPNPEVSGRGFARMRDAGVEVFSGFLVEEAIRLNWRFLLSTVYQRPAVTVKWAMSLDGKIATSTGESQWISSPEGRRWSLGLREEHDAILVGSGTVLADDPRLNRRLGRAVGPNLRVVLDRRLRTPPEASLFAVPGEVLIYTEQQPDAPAVEALRRRGATPVSLDPTTPETVLADLHARGVQSLLVEGGAETAAAFVACGAWDRACVNLAPKLIAGASAPGPLGGAGLGRLADAPKIENLRVRRRGPDLVMDGFRESCLPDLYAKLAV